MSRIKAVWEGGGAALGLWMASDSVAVAEVVARAGYDYVNIDLQHGLVDDAGALELMRALSGTEATVMCRVPWNEPGVIGRVLDAGAMGVIIPMVNTAAQAERAVAACRYAPLGSRSYGPIRAAVVNGPDYAATANERVVCIPMIETVEALSNLDAILSVPGIDAVYVGPADLSLTLGLAPAGDHDDASFNDALTAIVAGCRDHGVVPGIHANPQVVEKRLEQGFRMVTVTSDLIALGAGLTAALDGARSSRSAGTDDARMY